MPNDGGVFAGAKGESIFTEPFIDYQLSPNELPDFLQRIYAAGDDRSFAVFALIMIEKHLDELLETIAPGYKPRDIFTVSLKTEMLKAFRLIPPHILQAVDLARRARNEFAHKEWDNLEQLPLGLRNAIANVVRQTFGDVPSYFSSARETFKAAIFLVLAGLQAYRPNLMILREKLDDGELTEQLKHECHKRFVDGITLRGNKEPLRVEEKGGDIAIMKTAWLA
ncbi:MAG TPA: hypothetical protein VFK06_25675 [Candidatus Angelobacter sp.]|nr:hypothetical protein [Candidatus Angelobacter sp.]